MNKENLKERIQDCLLALDFDTDRMSTSGKQAYRELRNIVVELYTDNIKMQQRLKIYDLEEKSEEEEQEWVMRL